MSNPATGPRSDAGKERSSLNATKHGLRSERPVVPGEDPAEWDAFRAENIALLGPANSLERELAGRVVLELWRLRRAARYETEVVTDAYRGAISDTTEMLLGLDPADPAWKDFVKAQQDCVSRKEEHAGACATAEAVRGLPGLPDGAAVEPALAWSLILMAGGTVASSAELPATAGALKWALAAAAGVPAEEALARIAAEADANVQVTAAAETGARRHFGMVTERLARRGEARAHERRLPQPELLDRVIRYEAHVGRRLDQAWRLLRAAQAERRAAEQAAAKVVAPECGSGEGVAPAETSGRQDACPTGAARAVPRPYAIAGSFGNSAEAPPVVPERAAPAPYRVNGALVCSIPGAPAVPRRVTLPPDEGEPGFGR